MTVELLNILSEQIRSEWQGLPMADQLAHLRRHRLLPLALLSAQQSGTGFKGLLESVQRSVMESETSRVNAEQSLLRRLMEVLTAHRCQTILLKGAALGRSIYPSAHLRPCTDIDLLVDKSKRLDAHAALLAAGLQSDGYSQFDLASNQASYRDPITGRQIDLHWAINVLPELASRFCFADLYAESVALAEPADVRALGRRHALMHAVVHWHAQPSGAARPAIWLYDMALLVREFDATAWAALDRAVRESGLAALHAAALLDAQRWFPLDLPLALLVRWQELARVECTSALLKPQRSPLRRLAQSFGCTPRMSLRLAYLRARLFPSVRWMRGRYAARSSLQLTFAYLQRWVTGMRQVLRKEQPL